MPILVKMSHNWADEFDVHGFRVFKTHEAFEQWRHGVYEAIANGDSFYFGTNQGWRSGDITVEDFERGYTRHELGDSQYDVFCQFFNSWKDNVNFGNNPF